MLSAKRFLLCLVLLASAGFASASHLSAVSSDGCGRLKGSTEPFILSLKKSESVHEAILHCANDAELKGATLSGLGGIAPTTLLYFDHVAKKYHRKTIDEFMELVSLTGNITKKEGKRESHIHVALSNKDYQMTGGHLEKATVAAIAEIKVVPTSGVLIKRFDDETGLDVLVTD